MRRLPPLTAIEAFVQVARTGSIKAAAQELSLSAPALSRRIQALERFIDRPLFERRHQSLVLNEDGERLLQQIAPALDKLSDAVEQMTSGTEVLRLRLGVLPLWAAQRLFPRMGELRRAHPELHLDIDTGGQRLARLGEGIDVALTLEREVDPSLYARRLGRNTVVVIGARALTDGPNPVTDPARLAGLTALVHREMPETYTAFRRAAGLGDVEAQAIDYFDSGALMLEAAAQGLGIAFMLESHFDAAHDDRLVRLFPEVEVAAPYGLWFACRPRAMQTRAVKLFHDWLFATLGDDG